MYGVYGGLRYVWSCVWSMPYTQGNTVRKVFLCAQVSVDMCQLCVVRLILSVQTMLVTQVVPLLRQYTKNIG